MEAIIAAVLPHLLDMRDPEVVAFMRYCRKRVKTWMNSWETQAIDYARKWLFSFIQLLKYKEYCDCSDSDQLEAAIDKAHHERYVLDVFRWLEPYIDLNRTTPQGKDWLGCKSTHLSYSGHSLESVSCWRQVCYHGHKDIVVQLVTGVRLADLEHSDTSIIRQEGERNKENCQRVFDTIKSTQRYRPVTYEDFPLSQIAGIRSRRELHLVDLNDSDLDPGEDL